MEMPTWSFLVIAIIMAVVIGRAGTLLREQIKREKFYKNKRQREDKRTSSAKNNMLKHLFITISH
ncbi:hypothetical protein L1Z05_11485, partial [Acinetobacter baumannii]|nr:hypothetical protein [Acinetobacter baumannii]